MVEEKEPPAKIPIFGETEDLSRGGSRLYFGVPVRPGTAVHVTLSLKRPVSLTLTGRIVWSRPHPPSWQQGL